MSTSMKTPDGQAPSVREIERQLRKLRLPSPPVDLERRLLADLPPQRHGRRTGALVIASGVAAAAIAACLVGAMVLPRVQEPAPLQSADQTAAAIEREELAARLYASAKILAAQEEGQADAAAALAALNESYQGTAAWRTVNQK